VLWVSDITEHSTAEGTVYVTVVLDAWWARDRLVHPDHIRAELVADGL